MKYTRRCSRCGSDTQADIARGKVICDDCKEDQDKQKQSKIRRKREQRNYEIAEYRIVYDPIPEDEGGFKPGARINCGDLKMMVRADYRSFISGTIIMDKTGKKYIIQDRIGSNEQIVIAVKEEHEITPTT